MICITLRVRFAYRLLYLLLRQVHLDTYPEHIMKLVHSSLFLVPTPFLEWFLPLLSDQTFSGGKEEIVDEMIMFNETFFCLLDFSLLIISIKISGTTHAEMFPGLSGIYILRNLASNFYNLHWAWGQCAPRLSSLDINNHIQTRSFLEVHIKLKNHLLLVSLYTVSMNSEHWSWGSCCE